MHKPRWRRAKPSSLAPFEPPPTLRSHFCSFRTSLQGIKSTLEKPSFQQRQPVSATRGMPFTVCSRGQRSAPAAAAPPLCLPVVSAAVGRRPERRCRQPSPLRQPLAHQRPLQRQPVCTSAAQQDAAAGPSATASRNILVAADSSQASQVWLLVAVFDRAAPLLCILHASCPHTSRLQD